MADNVAVTAGAGTTIHADEYTHATLGSGKTQLVKLVDGTLDSDTAIAVDVGAKANALRVAPANNITDGTYIGDIKFGEALPAGTNAIGKLAANSGVDIGDVDITSVPVPLSTTGGGTEAAALRVTIANDSSGVVTVDDGGGALTVDGTVTESNSGDILTSVQLIDDAAATISSTDVLRVAIFDDSDAQITTFSGGTEYDEDVATPATISGGALMMERDDALSALTPIEGDWAGARCSAEGALWVQEANSDAILADTANMGTNLGTIAGDTTSIDGKITACNTGAVVLAASDGTDIGDVDVASMPANTFVAEDGALGLGVLIQGDDGTDRHNVAVDASGHLQIDIAADSSGGIEVVQDTAADLNVTEASAADILTAVQVMDDWDATHNSAASADGTQLMAAYDSTKPTAVDDGDAVRVLADGYGRLLSGMEPERFQVVYDSSNATAEGETVKAATAAKKIYILSAIISSDVEGWIKLQDEDSNALTGKLWLKAGGGMALTWPPEAPLVLDVANKALEVIAEAAGDISVTVTGYLAP